MAGLLLGTGSTLSYNGQAFDTLHRSRINGRYVYDDADRALKWVQYQLDVAGYINAGDGTTTANTPMATLRQTLEEPGKVLIYQNFGFGDLIVNRGGAGDPSDVNWGPKPKVIQFVPIGGQQTAFVEWSCTTCIPECANAKYTKAVAMLNYDVTYSFEDGWTTITYTGAIEIPLTFNSKSTRPNDSADRYRHLVKPVLPIGFKRSSTYKLSKDRRRLEFVITDRQIQVPLPPGVSLIDVDHSVRSNLQQGFFTWNCTLSGQVTMAPGEPKANAWFRFREVLISRLLAATPTAPAATPPPGMAGGAALGSLVSAVLGQVIPARPMMIVTDAYFGEAVFSTTSRFAITYQIIGASYETILNSSGLWRTVGPADKRGRYTHAAWAASVAKSILDERGASKLAFDHQKDTIINLCPQSTILSQSQTAPSAGTAGPLSVLDYIDQNVPGPTITYKTAPEDATWLKYDADIELIEDDHVIRHKPLAGRVTVNPTTIDPLGAVGALAKEKNEFKPQIQATVPDIVQRTSAPSIIIRLVGSALRVQFPIDPPALVRFMGKQVTQIWRQVRKRMSGAAGYPIHGCAWDIYYILAEQPPGLPEMANPMLGTSGGGGGNLPLMNPLPTAGGGGAGKG